jgi:hypothetical protein
MSRPLRLLLSVAFLGGCGGGTPEDPNTVPMDSGHEVSDVALEADDTGSDTAEPDAEPDADPNETTVRDTGPEILTCTGSQWEPNGSEGSAEWIGDITDCDGTGGSFSGVLGGGADVDWWHYSGTDKFGCSVDPTASTSSGVRLCMYVACKGGATELKGCTKGAPSKSPSGNVGCCADYAGAVALDFKCTLLGTDDSADVYLKLDDPSATTCKPYTVAYHF